MKGPNKTEWDLGALLTDPQKLFVLWVVKERFCVRLDDFRNHYGPDFPIDKLVSELGQDGFLQEDADELVLTETGEQAVACLREHEFSSETGTPHSQQIQEHEITPDARTSGQSILLVDNNSNFQETVREFLGLYGYQVLLASSPESAKEIMKREANALLVTDVRLLDDSDEKDVSGLTLIRQLDPAIPTIVLTAFPAFQDVREVLRPPSYAARPNTSFLAKQEGLPKLLATIRLLLAQFNSQFEV